MKNRWINLLIILLVVLIGGLFLHLFVFATTTAAASLIINILKPLNILLFVILCFILSRYIVTLYLGRKRKLPGARLRTKLVLSILPLTLVPSSLLFILATRFVDDILGNLVIDANIAKVIEASETQRLQHYQDLKTLYFKHAIPLLKLAKEQRTKPLKAYLDRYAIQGIEHYRNGRLLMRAMATSFPASQLHRIEDTSSDTPEEEPKTFDDGYLVIRFAFLQAPDDLRFIYAKGTPFSERFLFIRDSYTFLNHARSKTEKVKGLNQSILLITTLAIIFSGIWIGIAFAHRFLSAFNVLIQGAKQVAGGNFDSPINLKTGDEIEDVIAAFNSMTLTLKRNQIELERKANDLEQVNTEVSSQFQYIQAILQQVNAGILSVDQQGTIQTWNPAWISILGICAPAVGTAIPEMLDPIRHQPLLNQWDTYKNSHFTKSFKQLEFKDNTSNNPTHVASSMVPLLKEGILSGSLIVLEDLTQLLQAQKQAAWQEVAKRIAHEIKNPLTPIQLSIQRIHRKAHKQAPDLLPAIDSAYETIRSETALLKNLVNEFSTFAKMPDPVKAPVNLIELVTSVCQSYRPVFEKFNIKTDIQPGSYIYNCDITQIRQVLSNLINNSAQASQQGDTITVSLYTKETGRFVLAVRDEGNGIPESERDKVFLPYYSKSPKGTGLGLAIVKRIVEEHNGSITIDTNQTKGVSFIVSL